MPGHRHHRTDDQALRLKLAIFHALDSDTGTAGDARRLLKELAPLIEGWLTEAEGRAGNDGIHAGAHAAELEEIIRQADQ